ncbi:MAG: hypothetical protein ACRDWE_05730 [Acidimicrobiales bacterium]
MGRTMWRREHRALAAELVSDCETFLRGRYAERLEGQRILVPVWAWTNLLAHGSEPDLRDEAASARVGGSGTMGWRWARANLASELLAAIGPGSSLEEIQSSVLAPLELNLAARPEVQGWDRRAWLEIVRAAIRAHRPSRRY